MKWLFFLWMISCPFLGQSKEPISNYEVFFSSQDRLADELISMLDKERKSVKIAAYCLTHRGIVKALRQAQDRGVSVEVIVDPYSLRSKSLLRQMDKISFPVFVWDSESQSKGLEEGKRNKKRKSLMHDKFCILGDNRVWTGSFNFTMEGATVHQENAIVVESRGVASSYLTEFEKIKMSGCVPLKTYLESLK